LLAAALVIAGYTVWDNSRFGVSTVTLAHPGLPAAFEGYRIVQVSDLHSARFGVGQGDLLAAIKAAKPDLILLTGDYTDAWDGGAVDLSPVTELVRGLPSGVPVYYILGNWDARGAYGAGPELDTPLVKVLESSGAQSLYPYTRIERGTDHVWLTDWTQREFLGEASMRASLAGAIRDGFSRTHVDGFFAAWWARQQAGHDPAKEFDIAVTHRPLDFADYDAELARDAKGLALVRAAGIEPQFAAEVDYDVNIAGHTHGGQFRLPFFGALVSPEGQLFPPERLVAGLHADARGRVTYISRGLGAGGQVPWLRFRLFDTPELSVIVLHKGASQ
jgi:predicted MPP superfamily phosphohydrolase